MKLLFEINLLKTTKKQHSLFETGFSAGRIINVNIIHKSTQYCDSTYIIIICLNYVRTVGHFHLHYILLAFVYF